MSAESVRIIGWDSAVQQKNNGLVVLDYRRNFSATGDSLEWKAFWDGKEPLLDFLKDWISHTSPTVLAIDAPLGWPAGFASPLSCHRGGRPILGTAGLGSLIVENPFITRDFCSCLEADAPGECLEELETPFSSGDEDFSALLSSSHFEDSLREKSLPFFRRKTDIHIQQRLKKVPLEVSADRIARTAFFTLERVGWLEKHGHHGAPLGDTFGLVWDAEEAFHYGLLETYPAATLLGLGMNIRGYRGKVERRQEMALDLMGRYGLFWENPGEVADRAATLARRSHDFDALVCAFTAVEFFEGRCVPPPERSLLDIDAPDMEIEGLPAKHYPLTDSIVEQEGWIWAPG